MADEIKKTVVVETKVEGEKSIEDLAGDVRIAGISFNDLKGSVQATGRAFKGAVLGVNSFGKALKFLVAGAGPIGLLLTALAAVVAFFTKTRAGSEALGDALNVVGAVIGTLATRFGQLGGAIIKLITGDFSGFLEDTKAAFTGINAEIRQTITLSNELSNIGRALSAGEAALVTLTANLRREQQQLLLLTREQGTENAKNIERLEAARVIQDRIELSEQNLLELRLKEAEIAAELAKGGVDELETVNAINLARGAIASALAASDAAQREFQNRINTEQTLLERSVVLRQQGLDLINDQAFATENLILKTDELIKSLENEIFTADELATGIEALGDDLTKDSLGNLKLITDAQTASSTKSADEDKTAAQRKRDLAVEELELVGSIASTTAALGLESAGLTKAIAFFESIVNTASAIVRALPNVPLAVAVGILGAAQSFKIASTPLPTLAEGGGMNIGGSRHSSGGTKFFGSDGTAFEAERGEKLFVLSRGASKAFDGLNNFNSLFGPNSGGSFLQNGGLVSPSISAINRDFNMAAFASDIIRKIPPPEVSVLKIERARNEVAVTRTRGELA